MKGRSIAAMFNMGFITSSSIILVGSFVVNVLNYVFTLLISRSLGIEAFGEVTALFSLLLIVSVPASALTMLMTRQTAVYSTEGHDTVQEMFTVLRRNVALASFIFWLAFLFAIPLLARFLLLPYTPLFIFSLLIPITLASALQLGALQGLQEFFLLSKQSVLSTLIKLVVSLLLVYAGYSVVGVMLGLVLATLVSWGYGYLATRARFAPQKTGVGESTKFSLRSIRTLFSTILLTTLLLVLLSNIDVLMAKHFLPADLAGQYGALSTLGKILIYGIGAFITVLLPMVSAAHARDQAQDQAHEHINEKRTGKREGDKILALSLAIIAACSIAIYILFSFFPHLIVTLLFGTRYLAVAPYLGTFSIAMACISLATAFINYFVAVENTSFLYLLLGGILVEVGLISVHHASLGAMTGALVASSMTLLILMMVNYAVFCRPTTI